MFVICLEQFHINEILQNLETVCLTAIEDRLRQHIEERAYICYLLKDNIF